MARFRRNIGWQFVIHERFHDPLRAPDPVIAAVQNPVSAQPKQQFAKDFQKAAEKPILGLRTAPTALGGRPQASSSNDNGDVSWVVPAGLVNFPASVPGIGYHEWKAAVTPVSVSVEVEDPETIPPSVRFVPFHCQWKVGVGTPVAVTVNVAFPPDSTFWFAG